MGMGNFNSHVQINYRDFQYQQQQQQRVVMQNSSGDLIDD